MIAMTDYRLPPECRIRRKADFDRVFHRRCSAADGMIVVYGCENDQEHPRLGLVVSRKVGTAVVRNRWKRLLREAFRLSRPGLPNSIDLVVLPRPTAEPSLKGLMASLPRLAKRVAGKMDKDRC